MDYKLSVIVPVYNTELYLEECIISIVEQKYKRIELILVDDGSTDSSGAICDMYAEKFKNIVVIHKKNGGNTSAREAGVKLASGEWVGFVDSDDWVERDWFSNLLKETDGKELDVVFGGYVIENVSSIVCPKQLEGSMIYSRESALLALLQGINKDIVPSIYPSFWGGIVKKGIMNNIEYNHRIQYWEDFLGIWNILKQTDAVMYIPYRGYHYRRRWGSLVASSFTKEKLQYIEVPMLIEKDIEKTFKQSEVFEEMEQQITFMIFRNLCHFIYQMLIENNNYKSEIIIYKKILREYFKKLKHPMNDRLRELFNIVKGNNEEFKKRIESNRGDMLRELKKAIDDKKNIYIYGMGKIAAEVTAFLKNNDIFFSGYIVTEKRSGFERETGLNIISMEEANSEVMCNGVVVVALNEKNAYDVIAILEKKGVNYVNVGKYSRLY